MAAVNETTLRAQRSWVTRNLNRALKLLDASEPPLRTLMEVREKLAESWDKYTNLFAQFQQQELEAERTDTLTTAESEYDAKDPEVAEALVKLDVLIERNQRQSSNHQTMVGSNSRAPVRTVMPEIKIPKFHGDSEQWETFWDTFRSLVHERTDLDDVLKFTSLRDSVRGRAAKVIEGFRTTSHDYKLAIQTLIEHFANKDKIKRSIIHKLFDLQPPKHNAEDLLNFKAEFQSAMRMLEQYADVKESTWVFQEVVQRKLPAEVEKFIAQKESTQFLSMKEITEGLQLYIAMLEHSKENNKWNKTKEESQSKPQTRTPNKPPVGTYPVVANPTKCIFCGQAHFMTQCTTYPSVRDRRSKLSELNRCIRCTHFGHKREACRFQFKPCKFCDRTNHHSALCLNNQFDSNTNSTATNMVSTSSPECVKGKPSRKGKEKSQERDNTGKTLSCSIRTATHPDPLESKSHTSSTVLPTATIEVLNEGQTTGIERRAFFDQGSQRSFITAEIANKLRLRVVDRVMLEVSPFRSPSRKETFDVVRPTLKLGNWRRTIQILVVDQLPISIHSPGIISIAKQLQNKGIILADKHLQSDIIDEVGILLGADVYSYFITGLSHCGNVNLMSSPGGHLIYGPILDSELAKVSPAYVQQVTVNWVSAHCISERTSRMIDERCEPVSKLWDLDTIGIKDSNMSQADELTYQNYLSSVKYENNKYWVALPWKTDRPELPNNYRMASGQLQSLLHKMKQHPEYLDHYDRAIKDYVKSDFAEIVPRDELCSNQVHYLPHHAVRKDSTTTPLRVVFNCSARANKQVASLNDCLETGPSLTEKLGNMLLDFRSEDFAVTADISKAFLRVGLQQQDRNYTRYLWFDDVHKPNPKVVIFRFKSVLFGSTSSPFLLQATLDKHFRDSRSTMKEVLRKGFYVDNFLSTSSDPQKLVEIYLEANTELERADMPLQMWNTNDLSLQDRIDVEFAHEERAKDVSVLGLNWSVEKDTLNLKSSQFKLAKILTKRGLLSIINSVFDPLGLLTPITINGKILMQQAWLEKIDWDEPLPLPIATNWKELEKDYELLPSIIFPRSVGNCSEVNRLHVFCDASSKAYGAVAYVINAERSNILTSKARVAPVSSRTLPQLELTALQVGVQLAHYILNTSKLQFSQTVVWSDSEVTLQWVRNRKSDIVYVKNRVKDILHLSTNMKLLHVPTKMNPADLLSRGVKFKTLQGSLLWLHGPEWLVTGDWPEQKEHVTVNELVTELLIDSRPLEPLFDISRYSSLPDIFGVTNQVVKAVKRLLPRFQWYGAVHYWVQYEQNKHFCKIAALLHSDRHITGHEESKSMIKALGLHLDDRGLIRSRGRLANAELQFNTKYPVLISPKSHLTKLLILKAHDDVLHGGVAETLTQLRREFWVPKGRQAVKTIISKCYVCRRVTGQPYRYPEPPSLPEERVTLVEPFHTTGVDYTGAIQISKTPDGSPQRLYVCLFTCTATRAIHLELACDLSAETFLLLFRRFCARRSLPSKLISDNGTAFVASAKFLRGLAEDVEISNYMKDKFIDWKFIAPRAPWQGGFYERLIGIVKGCLKKVLFKKKISLDELNTFLAEVEMRVNNRPLTYVCADSPEIQPLTPSHLLHGRMLRNVPCLMNDRLDPPFLDSDHLRVQYIHVSHLIKQFERIWKADYLTGLREKHYGASTPCNRSNIKVGDIVLVQSDGPRSDWPLGKIIKLHDNPDHLIRAVDVLSRGKVSLRTVEKLIPLEVSSEEEAVILTSEQVELENEETVKSRTRPKRTAAAEADNFRRQLIRDECI